MEREAKLKQLHAERVAREQVELEQRKVLSDQKLRQSIRDSSQEIRDLKRMLNDAYISKEQKVQMKDAELVRERQRVGRL